MKLKHTWLVWISCNCFLSKSQMETGVQLNTVIFQTLLNVNLQLVCAFKINIPWFILTLETVSEKWNFQGNVCLEQCWLLLIWIFYLFILIQNRRMVEDGQKEMWGLGRQRSLCRTKGWLWVLIGSFNAAFTDVKNTLVGLTSHKSHINIINHTDKELDKCWI